MHSSRPNLMALAAVAAGLCFAGWAAADDAATRYNQMLARRQFIVSDSPTRTYSGLEPGPYGYLTPYGYVAFWGLPGWRHERISPRGAERFDAPATVAWQAREALRRNLTTTQSAASTSEGTDVSILNVEPEDRVLTTATDRVLSTRPTEAERELRTTPAGTAGAVRAAPITPSQLLVPLASPYLPPDRRIVIPPPPNRLPPPPPYSR